MKGTAVRFIYLNRGTRGAEGRPVFNFSFFSPPSPPPFSYLLKSERAKISFGEVWDKST